MQRGAGITTTPVHEPSHDSIRAATPELEEIVRVFLRDNGLPGGSVGLVVGSSLAWSAGLGNLEAHPGGARDDRTLYRIGSITKTFTATAILALRDAGSLRLDDPLVHHVPEFAAARNPFGPVEAVTLRRLLRHTAGLQGEVPWSDPRRYALLRPHEVIAALDRTAVVIPPDSAYKYSNLGYHLLGEVVRRVSGRSWEAYLQQEILEPLGMIDTVTDPADRGERVAVGYARRSGTAPLSPARVLEPDQSQGDGALWSTVADLARWVSLQFRTDPSLAAGGPQVVSGATVAEMHRPMVVIAADLSAAVGLGWRTVRHGETLIVGHGGFVQGFTARIDAVPSERVGSIVLVNGVGDPSPAADLSWALLERVLPVMQGSSRGGSGRTPNEPAREGPDAFVELAGTYIDPEFGNAARVEPAWGTLVLVDLDTGERRAVAPTDDPLRFTFLDGRPAGEDLLFLRADDGRIDALNAAGYPMVRAGLTGGEGARS